MSVEKQPYYLNGREIPSVTKIIGLNLGWNKDALLKWTRNQAMKGNDPHEIRDHSAALGTLVHSLIEQHLTGKEIDTSEYSLQDKFTAKKCFEGFLDWFDRTNIKPTNSEVPLLHKDLEFGGTIDMMASIDGVASIVDFKTSNNLWREHRIQLAAYAELVYHNYGYYPDLYLLHINKEYGTAKPYPFRELEREWQIFELLLKLHRFYSLVR